HRVDERFVLLVAADLPHEEDRVDDDAGDDEGKDDEAGDEQADVLPADDDPADVERQRAPGEGHAEDDEDGDGLAAPARSHAIKLTRPPARGPKRAALRRPHAALKGPRYYIITRRLRFRGSR